MIGGKKSPIVYGNDTRCPIVYGFSHKIYPYQGHIQKKG